MVENSMHTQVNRINLNQVVFTIFIFGLAILEIYSDVKTGLIYTAFAFIFILFFGLRLCQNLSIELNDNKLNILKTFWLIKLGMIFVLLHLGWIPELEAINLETWGYDPQRYYIDAYDLILNGWNPTQSTNYQGIIFYYGFIFFIFGHNPVIPALVNSFVSLIGGLYLIRICYQIKKCRTHSDWSIAFVLLVPEIIWYDVMTSRETLLAALILISSLSMGRYLINLPNSGFIFRTMSTTLVCLFFILAIRSTMVIPVLSSFLVAVMLIRRKRSNNWSIKLIAISVLVITLLSGPFIQSMLGGYNFNFATALSTAQNIEGNVASEVEWTDNSVGLLLSPHSSIQSLLFLPPRMVLYLVSPLPNIAFSLDELARGSWSAWQNLMTIPSSILYIILFPFVLAGSINSYRIRIVHPGQLLLVSIFWITFIAIAGGNIIIHERYRVMFSPLFIACAWLGYIECKKLQIQIISVGWFGLLAFFSIMYVAYKMF